MPQKIIKFNTFLFALLAFSLVACTSFSKQDLTVLNVEKMENDSVNFDYGVLLLDQSIRNEDYHGVYNAAKILENLSNNSRFSVEAAAWLLLNKTPEAAREILESAIIKFPADLNLYLLLSEAWVEEARYDNAIDLLKSYSLKYPDSKQAKQELAILLTKSHRFAEAIDLFEALDLNSFTSFTHYCYAIALNHFKEYDKSLLQLRQATVKNPDFTEVKLELARTLSLTQHFSEANKILLSLFEEDLDNFPIFNQIIFNYISGKQINSALDFVAESSPTSNHLFVATWVFIEEGYYETASKVLDLIERDYNASEELHFLRALILFEYKRDHEAAIAVLSKISKESELYERVLRLYVAILLDLKRNDEALNLIHKAQNIYTLEPTYYLVEAELYNKLGEYQKSYDVLKVAEKIFPEDLQVKYNLGLSLEMLGKSDDAVKIMEHIIALDYNYYQALNFIGYYLADRNKDLERAKDLLYNANALSPNSSYILDSLAWLEYRLKNYELALEYIEMAISLPGGHDPIIFEHYGDILVAVKRNNDAKNAYLKAIENGHTDKVKIQIKMEKLK